MSVDTDSVPEDDHLRRGYDLLEEGDLDGAIQEFAEAAVLTDLVENGEIADLQAALRDKSRFTSPQLVEGLACAAVRGSVPAVDALLMAGADPNGVGTRGSAPLICAIESGDAEVVERIVRAGADVNRPDKVGNLPLIWAIDYEVDTADQCREELQCNISRKLIELGADPSLRGAEGEDAVQFARQRKHALFLDMIANLHS